MYSPSEKLRPYSQLRTYKKGANIFFQGEIPRHGAMITDGFVRAYSITTTGEERTITYFTKGDILPLSWLMETTTTSLFYYEATSDVRLLLFSRDDFTSQVLGDPHTLRAMVDLLSTDYSAAMLRINGLEQSRANEKVAYTLYYLMFRYGVATQDEQVYLIDMTLRHTTIASLVGLSRESTTKILGSLQKLSIVHYEKGRYSVNKQLLENYIGEDSFRDLSFG